MALADTIKALSDAQRRDILGMLRAWRMSAGKIAEKLEITLAALSYHLKLLKKADLVLEYKEKNFVSYEVNVALLPLDVLRWSGNTAISKNPLHYQPSLVFWW